jgi:peroxiredoxin Q/BCP
MTASSASAAQQASQTLAIGDKAPAFDLPATGGGGNISLAGLKGKNAVLYFYPKDDTPGCTVEAKDFRDAIKDFDKADTTIIGLSKDDVRSHEDFKEKFCLPFALASDVDGATCVAYGVWAEKSMYGKKYMGIERTTFLIDKQGRIARIWPKVKVEGHAKEVLEAAKGLK